MRQLRKQILNRETARSTVAMEKNELVKEKTVHDVLHLPFKNEEIKLLAKESMTPENREKFMM